MKILIIGSDKHWAIENHFLKFFEGQDLVEARLFPAHNIFHQFYYRSIFNKIFFRLGLSSIFHRINKDLIKYVNDYQPDIIWVFKGMEIFPATLQKFRKQNIFLANYNPDHPFIFTHKGSGNKNVLKGVPLYDLHFSYSQNILKEIKSKYGIEGVWLPFAYQQTGQDIEIPEDDRLKACFIGNPDNIRATFIRFLGERGIPIDVYGHDWDKHLKNINGAPITIYPPVFKEAFPKTAIQYRFQLNIFRPQNLGSHNMRTFEMPALGCIMLAPRSAEHQMLFKENKEAFYFKDMQDALDQAKAILALSKEEAFSIKNNALKRSRQSAYTYQDRAKQVLDVFWNIVSN